MTKDVRWAYKVWGGDGDSSDMLPRHGKRLFETLFTIDGGATGFDRSLFHFGMTAMGFNNRFSVEAIDRLYEYMDSRGLLDNATLETFANIRHDYAELIYQEAADDYDIDISDCESAKDKHRVVKAALGKLGVLIAETDYGFLIASDGVA